MTDVLSRVLDAVRPHGVVVTEGAATSATSPGLAVLAPIRAAVRVHVDQHPTITVTAGEAVLVIGEHRYTVQPLARTGSLDTHVVTATYAHGSGVCDRVVGGLPTLLTADGDGPRALVELLLNELRADRAGRSAVVARLADLLLIAVLREWMDQAREGTPPWYRAMQDPNVGTALRLIHQDPAHPWTVGELATRCSLSRAAFSRRFGDLVGEPPASYLTCWRLCLAGDLLRDTDETLASIARQVGYGTAYAFSAAWTRVHGVRPGAYRANANQPLARTA